MRREGPPRRTEAPDTVGPDSDKKDEIMEVTDSQILGPADEDAEKTRKLPESGEDKTKVLENPEKTIVLDEAEGTGEPESPEVARERQDKLVARFDGIRQQIAASREEAGFSIPQGEAPQTAEEAEIAHFAAEAQEIADQADELSREWNLKAIRTLEEGSEDRLDRAGEFLAKWPNFADEFESAGLNEGELTIVALRFARENPKDFVEAMSRSDLGLSVDEKAAIAEEIRDTNPDILPRALHSMGLPTEHVTEILKGVSREIRERAFSVLEVPIVSEELAAEQTDEIETRERGSEELRKFREISHAVTLEVLRSSPDRLEHERERSRIERELSGRMTHGEEFGNTAAAPMIVTMEGRDLPGLYKAASKEVENRKEKKVDVRPGIEAETVPSREWLAYQIDKALQLDVVPTTVMRDGPEGIGSLQDWDISERVTGQPFFRMAETDESFRNELAKIAFLDIAIENTDRHLGNFQQTPDGRLVAIDNGLTHARPDSESDHVQSWPLFALQGQEIPSFLREDADQLLGNEDLKAALRQAFEHTLGDDAERAWDAFNRKLKSMSESGKFPTFKELEDDGSYWHRMFEDRIEYEQNR